MVKKILFIFSLFFFSNIVFSVDNQQNPILKAFEERKQKVVNIIEGDKLTQEIKNIENQLNKIGTDEELNQGVIEKLQNELEKLKEKYNTLTEQIKNSQNISDNEKKLAKELEDTIKTKEILLEKLQKQSDNNKIQQEKLDLLLNKYLKEKQAQQEIEQTSDYIKYIIFFSVTIILGLIYFIVNFLYKKEKIDKRIMIYTNFFLIFGYTIFLIWFFFYLHPELSIFLIFISGYLLAINAHLIASFIGSIIILRRFQIGDVIKLEDFKGQIQKITTINTILLPITDEGILTNKPIIIPNVELLKNTVIKDETPEVNIYEYKLKFPADTKIDIMKMIEHIEQNILFKRLNNRLSSLNGSDDSYRTSIGFDKFGRISIKFIWRGDDLLNKQIERKIMGYVMNLKKEERELEKKEKEEKEIKDNKEKENNLTNN